MSVKTKVTFPTGNRSVAAIRPAPTSRPRKPASRLNARSPAPGTTVWYESILADSCRQGELLGDSGPPRPCDMRAASDIEAPAEAGLQAVLEGYTPCA